MIEVPAQANAAQMLQTQAVCLGQMGDDQYFLLDGKVWLISAGVVFRSDDDLESRALLRKVKRHFAQAPPQPTDKQPMTDFNPDGMDADALWDFCEQTQQTCRQTARRLFPDRPQGYVRTTAALGNYAANKATALRQRARGDIPTAKPMKRSVNGSTTSFPITPAGRPLPDAAVVVLAVAVRRGASSRKSQSTISSGRWAPRR